MKRKLAIAWLTVGGGILGGLYFWMALQNATLLLEIIGVVGLFAGTLWSLNVLATVPPATSECGDADETDGARNIKNDANEGEAARKE